MIRIGEDFLLDNKSIYAAYQLPKGVTCAHYYIPRNDYKGVHLFLMKDPKHRVTSSDYTLVVCDEREEKVERRSICVLSDVPLICHNLAKESLYTNNEITDTFLRAQVLFMIGLGKCKLSKNRLGDLLKGDMAQAMWIDRFGKRWELSPVVILGNNPLIDLCEFSRNIPYCVCLKKVKQNDKIVFRVRCIRFKQRFFYQWQDVEEWGSLITLKYTICSPFLKGVFDRVFESPSEWMRFLDQNRAQLEERERKFYNENKIEIEDKKEEPQVEEEKGKKPLRKGESPEKTEKNEIIMKEDKDPFGEN